MHCINKQIYFMQSITDNYFVQVNVRCEVATTARHCPPPPAPQSWKTFPNLLEISLFVPVDLKPTDYVCNYK
jgi:hypothetical protein